MRVMSTDIFPLDKNWIVGGITGTASKSRRIGCPVLDSGGARRVSAPSPFARSSDQAKAWNAAGALMALHKNEVTYSPRTSDYKLKLITGCY
tara:strand:+ start:892 stop:1167 length:276 start_codon:yes stop_codon:yes gene_type:complete